MKLRKLGFTLVLAVILAVMFPVARGDMFPKPQMTIKIQGVGEPYYFDLLVYDEDIPTVVSEDVILQKIEYDYYRDDYPDALNGFQDEDGYVSYQLYRSMPTNITLEEVGDDYQIFGIGYYSPPQRFKIMVYTEAGVMITSKAITRLMFHAEFTYELSGVDTTFAQANVGTVTENLPLGRIGTEFIVRLIITVLLEIGVLLLFGFRAKKSILIVSIANLISQTLLTAGTLIGHYVMSPFFGAVFILIVGELIVVILEAIVYSRLLIEKSRRKAVVYAIIANLASMVASFFLIVIGNYI